MHTHMHAYIHTEAGALYLIHLDDGSAVVAAQHACMYVCVCMCSYVCIYVCMDVYMYA
jgi:hypothetical protein